MTSVRSIALELVCLPEKLRLRRFVKTPTKAMPLVLVDCEAAYCAVPYSSREVFSLRCGNCNCAFRFATLVALVRRGLHPCPLDLELGRSLNLAYDLLFGA